MHCRLIDYLFHGLRRAVRLRSLRGASNGHTATSKIDWSNLQVGDLGIVRNHSYSVNVTAINGLGTAISDYEAPIVPPADTKEQYVSYKVNILKWAVVPAQNVEL